MVVALLGDSKFGSRVVCHALEIEALPRFSLNDRQYFSCDHVRAFTDE